MTQLFFLKKSPILCGVDKHDDYKALINTEEPKIALGYNTLDMYFIRRERESEGVCGGTKYVQSQTARMARHRNHTAAHH